MLRIFYLSNISVVNFNKRLKSHFVNAQNRYKQRGDKFLLILNEAAKCEAFQIIKEYLCPPFFFPITTLMLRKKTSSSSSQAHFSSASHAEKPQKYRSTDLFGDLSDRKVETAVVLDCTEKQDLRYLEIHRDVNNQIHKNQETNLTLLISLQVMLK